MAFIQGVKKHVPDHRTAYLSSSSPACLQPALSPASEDSRLRAQDLISAESFLINEGEWSEGRKEGEGGSLDHSTTLFQG